MCKEYINIQTGEKLDPNKIIKLSDKMMLKKNPQMWEIWDFEKNIDLDIYKITNGSGRKAWWYCAKCDISNIQFVKNKTKGIGCPTCRGYYPSKTNNLVVTHPHIAKQWHPTKNGDLTPFDVTFGSEQIVWWLGECGHEWDDHPCHRTRKITRGCPYCSSKRIDKNINSLSFTNPEIIEYLVNKEDGDKYSKGSDAKLKWKCECGAILNKSINFVVNRGLCCGRCSDGRSFGERIMFNLLIESGLDFDYDISTEWSEGKRYDFIIYKDEKFYILEVQGEQHSDNGKKNRRGRSLEEELNNDALKMELAIKNGVTEYFYIKSENQNIDVIMKDVYDNNILELLRLENLNKVELLKKSRKSIVFDVCKFYNESEIISTEDIMKKFKISNVTVRRYLHRGNEMGICKYSKYNNKLKKNADSKLSHKVVQLTLNNEFVNEHASIRSAVISLGYNRLSTISECCKGLRESSIGYKWMYKKDYDKYTEEAN